jgi:hypothetical protein
MLNAKTVPQTSSWRVTKVKSVEVYKGMFLVDLNVNAKKLLGENLKIAWAGFSPFIWAVMKEVHGGAHASS